MGVDTAVYKLCRLEEVKGRGTPSIGLWGNRHPARVAALGSLSSSAISPVNSSIQGEFGGAVLRFITGTM